MRVLLVRHAKQSEVGDDPSLTEVGLRQAALLAERIAGFSPDKIVVSTLVRAQETYRACADALAGVPVEHSDAWVEISTAVIGGPKEADETGIQSDRERVGRLYDSLSKMQGTTIVFCHGNLIRALLARVLDVSPTSFWERLSIDHAGLTVIDEDELGLHISRVNDTHHLS